MHIKRIILALSVSVLTACATPHLDESTHGHAHVSDPDHGGEVHSGSGILDTKVVKATRDAPEYTQFANNIEIINNVSEAMENTSSTFTHEGYFSPLLFGETLRAYILRLEPGMFLSEHPHPTESIVYTMGGRWVLSSEEKRQIMETGSIFHFGSNMPTGWEAAFSEGADLLIFKRKREGETYQSFTEGMRNLAVNLDERHKDGETFYYHQLAPNHPAVVFAKQHNPNFDQLMKTPKPTAHK